MTHLRNRFFAVGLTDRIEGGIKGGIETQASGTMTVASECLTQKVAKLLVRDGDLDVMYAYEERT